MIVVDEIYDGVLCNMSLYKSFKVSQLEIMSYLMEDLHNSSTYTHYLSPMLSVVEFKWTSLPQVLINILRQNDLVYAQIHIVYWEKNCPNIYRL